MGFVIFEGNTTMANNNKFGKNSWKIGMWNFIIGLFVLVVIGAAAGGAYLFIKPKYDNYQTAKAAEQKVEETKAAQNKTISYREEYEKNSATRSDELQTLGSLKTESTASPSVQPEDTPTPQADPDYIIADSNSRYLTNADVQNLSIKQINYAKNEIYARKGRKFQSKELQDYFNSKSWYHGTVEPDAFTTSCFNEYEIANAEFLSKTEFSMNPNGYQLDQ